MLPKSAPSPAATRPHSLPNARRWPPHLLQHHHAPWFPPALPVVLDDWVGPPRKWVPHCLRRDCRRVSSLRHGFQPQPAALSFLFPVSCSLSPDPATPVPPSPPPPARSWRAPSTAACTSRAPSPHLSGRSAQSAPRPAAPAPPASSPDTASAETHTAPPPRAGSSHRAVCVPVRPATRPPHSPPPPHECPPGRHDRSRDTHPSPACNPPASVSPLELPPAPPARAPPAPTASAPPPSSPHGPWLRSWYPRAPAPRRSTSPQHNSARSRTSHTAPIASVSRETSLPQFKSRRTTAPRKNHPVLPAIPPRYRNRLQPSLATARCALP